MEMLNSARTLSEAYFGPPLSVPCLEFQPSVLSEVMTWRSSSMRASIILSSTIAGGPGWLGDIIGNAVSIIVFLEFTGRVAEGWCGCRLGECLPMALAWDFRFASPRTIERERGGCFFAVSVERRRGEGKV